MARATPPIRNGESVNFVALNRNKRSLVLDLKRPEAIEVLLALARRSDALIEAYRPGALEKLGLGANAVKAVNPQIIYTSVSGFGQTGPYRRRAGVNLIIEAFSGTLSVTGEPGKMPMRPGVQTADVFGALFATYATLSGLVGASRAGEGFIADVSLVEASIAAAAWEAAGVTCILQNAGEEGQSPLRLIKRLWEAADYLETGHAPKPLGNRHRLNAPYQLFECKDGRYVAIGTSNDQHFASLMKVLGLEDHVADPRFASYASRKQHEDALLALVEPAVCARKSREIEAALMAAGLPCSCVNNFKEVFDDPHMIARGIVRDVEHPRLGSMRAVRNPILFDHDSPSVDRHAPMLGEHSEEVLSELGYSVGKINELFAAGVTAGGQRRTAGQAAE